MHAFIDSNGVLTSWGYAESNNDDTLVEVPEDFSMTPGAAQYKDGVWSDYSVPVDHSTDNKAMQTQLITDATLKIAIYTDATDPDIVDTVDPKDTAALKAWKQYRVAVNKVDLTQSEPTWPQAPQS